AFSKLHPPRRRTDGARLGVMAVSTLDAGRDTLAERGGSRAPWTDPAVEIEGRQMQRHVARFAVVRYGVAVSCVTVAVILALWLRPVVLAGAQLLLVAVLITGWVAGLRPALAAWILATLAFAYYFTPPFDSLQIDSGEMPRLLIFTLLAAFLATLSAARRRAEDALTTAREQLEARVRERTLELERALAEAVAAQHRFTDLVNSVDGIVWEADGTMRQFAFVSDQAERILGYPVERWLSEPTFWRAHLHPDDRESVLRFRETASAEKPDGDCEYRMIAADGRVVWLRDLVTVCRTVTAQSDCAA